MATITHVPLLQAQRELLGTERGSERFRRYLDTMIGEGTDDEPIELPLSVFNPMSRDHVRRRLDEYLALDAEAIVAAAVAEALPRLRTVEASLRVALVMADDARGGWTNRYSTEMGNHFDARYDVRHGWVLPLLWSSEAATAAAVRAGVLAQLYRILYLRRHGPPLTLCEHMRLQGRALVFAGAVEPRLEAEDLEYSRQVIGELRETDAYPVIVACLYGDEAARELGYAPQGLSRRAGEAVALADAMAEAQAPETALEAAGG